MNDNRDSSAAESVSAASGDGGGDGWVCANDRSSAVEALFSFFGFRRSGGRCLDASLNGPADDTGSAGMASSGRGGDDASGGASPDSQSLLRLSSALRSKSSGGGGADAAVAVASGGSKVSAEGSGLGGGAVGKRFSPEEMDVLLRIHRLLLLEKGDGPEAGAGGDRVLVPNRSLADDDDDDDGGGGTYGRDNNPFPAAAESSLPSSTDVDLDPDAPFLLTLATCAARAALEEAERYHGGGDDDEDEDSAAAAAESKHESEGGPNTAADAAMAQLDTLRGQLCDAHRSDRRSERRRAVVRDHLRRVRHLHRRVLPSSSVRMSDRLDHDFRAARVDRTVEGESLFLDAMAMWLGRHNDGRVLLGGGAAMVHESAVDLVFDCCQSNAAGEDNDATPPPLAPDDLADAAALTSAFYRLAVAARALDPDRCPLLGESMAAASDAPGGGKDRSVGGSEWDEGESAAIGPLGSTAPLTNSLLEFAAARGGCIGLSSEGVVTRAMFREWHGAAFPHLASALPAFMESVVFPPAIMDHEDEEEKERVKKNGARNTGQTPTTMPRATSNVSNASSQRQQRRALRPECPIPDMPPEERSTSAFLSSPNSPGLYTLASLSRSTLGGRWSRLFSTDADGCSFHRLEDLVCGYGGPTLLLVRAYHPHDDGLTAIFGAYAPAPWKKSTTFFGTDGGFLFQLQPTVRIMRAKKGMAAGHRGRRYQYLNPSAGVGKAAALGAGSVGSRHTAGRAGRVGGRGGADGAPAHGLGFGGTESRPRLFVSESLDHCHANSSDGTYEDGELFPLPSSSSLAPPSRPGSQVELELDSLEVWAPGSCGDVAAALVKREKHRGVVRSNINKAAKVDRSAFLGDLKSGLIESKMFTHREQMRGRDGGGCQMEDDEV